jgi:Uma2 family endonuclease
MVQQLTMPPRIHGQWLPMTYEEFLAWANGMHGEWVDGEWIIFVGATDEHQWAIAFLYELLFRFTRIYDLGRVIRAPFGMKFRPGGPHREPDVLFLAKPHLDRWTPTGIVGPADFASEVVSDDSEVRDLVDKLRQYAELGVPEYLALDRRSGHERFDYHRLAGDRAYHLVVPDAQGRYHSEVLPGLWLRAEWFLQTPLPPVDQLLFEIAGDDYWAWLKR